MNRFKACFENKSDKNLAIYYTAGYPNLYDTLDIAVALEKAGANIIEIGMPFSDPLADGPVIQDSSTQALNNGMTIARLFEQLTDLRKYVNIPVVLMGYINPVLRFGKDRFLDACQKVGIDGLILPDIPLVEFEKDWKADMDALGLSMTFLVTPETPHERVQKIDALSSGFLYLVSSSSTTGGEKSNLSAVDAYTKGLSDLALSNPLMVGFGISDAASFGLATQHTHGAIIGSAFIKHLSKHGPNPQRISDFVHGVKGL